MMSFGVVTWIFLSGVTAGEADIRVSGRVGGYIISFSCPYWSADTNTKYFCKYPCTADRHILIRSGQSPAGRYRLKDSKNGVFTVTITDLQKSDTGTYRCGVDRFGIDTYSKVLLSVTDAPTSNMHPPKATPKAAPPRVAPPRTVRSNEPSTFPQSTIPPCTTSASTISFSTPKPTLPAQRSLSISLSTSVHVQDGSDGHRLTGTLLYTAAGLGALVIISGLSLIALHKCKRTTSESPQRPGAETVYAEVKKPQAAITQGQDTLENPLYSYVELKEDPFIYSTVQEPVY